jgi:hypothetical protein
MRHFIPRPGSIPKVKFVRENSDLGVENKIPKEFNY